MNSEPKVDCIHAPISHYLNRNNCCSLNSKHASFIDRSSFAGIVHFKWLCIYIRSSLDCVRDHSKDLVMWDFECVCVCVCVFVVYVYAYVFLLCLWCYMRYFMSVDFLPIFLPISRFIRSMCLWHQLDNVFELHTLLMRLCQSLNAAFLRTCLRF